jgi:hypothetical protein
MEDEKDIKKKKEAKDINAAMGMVPDGRIATFRNYSSISKATLEVLNLKTRASIKIRYMGD